jgi:magnesium chelatase family protein
VRSYLSRVSGPLLDQMDLQVQVPAVSFEHLAGQDNGASSSLIRQQVIKARQLQEERFKTFAIFRNAQMNTALTRRFCALDSASLALLQRAMERFRLSARAYGRILKLARTIADLDAQPDIKQSHLAEAISYRSLDREMP